MSTHPQYLDNSTLRHFKKLAKRKAKSESIPLCEAQQLVARDNGFPNWKAVVKANKTTIAAQRLFPFPEPVKATEEELETIEAETGELSEERTEDLATAQKLLAEKNKRFLTKEGIEFSVFEPTKTGLKKSIFDAIQPVRTHFELSQFHSYEQQQQGKSFKVVKPAYIYDSNHDFVSTRMSLYRPETKKGDPRMWFYKSKELLEPNHLFAIIIFEESAYVINITKVDLEVKFREQESNLFKFLGKVITKHSEVSNELLDKLKLLSKAPLKAISKGDTTIGMTIESALGIAPNSDKAPDYKGIELKSARFKSNRTPTRSTLFAQVPNWKKSRLDSSAKILDQFGYERDGAFKLYCSISSLRSNSQGLQFKYDSSVDELIEVHETFGEVARWDGKKLRARLNEKHAETFWIEAESLFIDGVEHFQLKSVTHTKGPILTQLLPLIESGVIEMDHLIKRTYGAKPRVSEKGPLFKIGKKDLGLLFPSPQKYSL